VLLETAWLSRRTWRHDTELEKVLYSNPACAGYRGGKITPAFPLHFRAAVAKLNPNKVE
jgi:hypothetical protein